MCPVTVWWFRLTWATIEALRIFSFLDNDTTIGGLSRELPQYIAATQDILRNVRERKLSGGGSTRRGFLIGLLDVPYCGSLSGFYVTSPRLPFTQSWGNKTKIQKLAENYGLKQTQNNFALFYSVTNKEHLGQKYWVSGRDVRCFPILSYLHTTTLQTSSLKIWERPLSWHAKCSRPVWFKTSKFI